jgi:hypothetical protein
MKLPIKNVLVLKKKGQNTTKKSQSCALMKGLVTSR